jgi:hypothetical protein
MPLAAVAARTAASLALSMPAIAAPAGADGPPDAPDSARAMASERLDRIRADPRLADDPVVIGVLARQAETFPPGAVRTEARMLVAEAWLGRMNRPDEAITELRRVADDPDADGLSARLAERELVGALLAKGDTEAAGAEARARASRLDPRFLLSVRRTVRRPWLLRAAFAVLTAFVAGASVGLVRASQGGALGNVGPALRRLAPVAVPFVAVVAVGGGTLASRYEAGNAAPFLLLGAILVPTLVLAGLWSAVGSMAPAARAGRAALCGLSVVAAAFVLLDLLGPDYLDGFGL